ncbi:FHA domain-containing protein [Thermoleptolyngbya sp. C42_A2020_037]|uniref:FHA domain-containing protein n=1 Tax=Thermoleptolyngbya sp. C42_A2020_037 TaxID=2747799 RepID=UPI0019DFAB1E|nr:FHA domain-containing protein [Thermoleptolyngbya sp. C42_A2020_037]MBF2086337.1 FHA domain-containing protein [Thermoleptolyngbya sp. C42_A2020_037]
MSASHPNHLIIIEDNKGRREYTLESEVYSIGRDPTCDIRLISQFVSRHHATLVRMVDDHGGYYYRIVDGNGKGKASSNGLLINGKKLGAHDLENQDKVVFGPQVQAIYYMLKRENVATVPPDEFDITLISPNMIDEEGEGSAGAAALPEDLEDDELEDDELEDEEDEDLEAGAGFSSSSSLAVEE